MNEVLMEDFKEEEIKKAMKEMGSTKAPRYDGFPAHIIGTNISKFYLKALNRVISLNEINFTKIILILKNNSANVMTAFCLISLCSMLYKIISKVIANCLKMVLDDCINET
ncbi:reverse transcriptase [Gossypium australe]|uniref:Reverse transcriptase n=1 Tax=Gossypium australe TaxID=47621 RepID=A0A5B6WIH0_9ROSI|nr:reverse transcriptase [Gossypium australe]